MKHLSVSGALALCFVMCLPAQGQSAQDLLQQGVRLEQVQGDYEGAIALYRGIASDATADRRVVAQALMQLGKAYESLGRNEAFSAYDRVAREFSDQSDLVAEARMRMRALAPASAEAAADQNVVTYSFPYQDYFTNSAIVSNSGRLVVQVKDDGAWDVVDLEAGTTRNLSLEQSGCPGDRAPWPIVFSPDDSKIAVQCSHNRPRFMSMAAAVYDFRTGVTTEVVSAEDYFGVTDTTTKHMTLAVPFDWSEDGRSLLVKLWDTTEWTASGAWAKQTMDIGLFPIDGSAPTVISHLVDGPNSDPWLNGACLMHNDRIVLTQYAVHNPANSGAGSRGQIRAVDVSTGSERLVRDAESNSFSLLGCDRKRARVYFSQRPRSPDFQTDHRSLWTGEVTEQGEFRNQRFVRDLPVEASSMMTRGGSVIYAETRGSGVNGIFQAEFDPQEGRMVGDPRMLEAMGGSGGKPEVFSTDGRQLLWTHWPTANRKISERYVSEDGGPFTPVNLTLGSAYMLNIKGDRVVYSDSSGTFAANWRTGELLDSLATCCYVAASQDLRFLYRMDEQARALGIDTTLPVDEPLCVFVLDRTTGKEDTLFCTTERATGRSQTIQVDPASGRVAIKYIAADTRTRTYSLEVYDPEKGSSTVVLQAPYFIFPKWAGGRIYVSHGYPTEFLRFDPATGDREALNLDRLQETVTTGYQFWLWHFSPDERQMFFHGHQPASGIDVVVIKDPLAGK